MTRRDFLKTGAAFGAWIGGHPGVGRHLKEIVSIENPLAQYPDREWEKCYRDIYKVDSTFHFLCIPNDTHGCYLKAHVRNGVIVRIGPSFGYGKAEDLYGNKASARWDPRICQKGLAMLRRIQGDRRVKVPMVRKGFLEWAKKGFPRDPDTGKPPASYFERGTDHWVRVSWDEACDITAKALMNISKTYDGDSGAAFLKQQNYDDAMIAAMHGAGMQTVKMRGGMPLLGVTRIFGMYRFANMLALLDAKNRGLGPDQALGSRGWDNYTWHTDLPPGHPMVTGQQTVDFDLFDAENAKLILCWGMNWISTKMPDGHWLSEARIKGTKVVTIACEYQSTSARADEVVIIRPGTDTALALGMAQVIIKEGLYDREYVMTSTDLPLLVRMDTLKLLTASDLDRNYKPSDLTNFAKTFKKGEKLPPMASQDAQLIPEELRAKWSDAMVWDRKNKGPLPVTRDQVGDRFPGKEMEPALDGEYEVTLADGGKIKVRSVFSLISQYLTDGFDPGTVSRITWIPKEVIESLARDVAKNRSATLLATGMGPNHFFNNDLKDRAVFLLAALTRNIGLHGGNVGSFAGNYRGAYFNGLPQFILEDPFNPQLDADKPARVKKYYYAESAHYYNYGDRPLRVGKKLFTGKSHVPTPTKVAWFSNSNSILGNIKWHYDVVKNTLPRVEMIVAQEWMWTLSCEWSDIVFPVDSWAELKSPDMAGSVTNPFLMTLPRTPFPRIFDTRGDLEVLSGVSKKLASLTGDKRFEEYWKFLDEGKMEVYLQRILDGGNATKGYRIQDLEEKAKQGIPALKMTRTYPITKGWEQTKESRPWYTRTGRLEFYRDEAEFLEYGENLPVYREPVDGTPYEPNVIVGKPHPALRPTPPADYGVSPNDLSSETRQIRNVLKPWDDVEKTSHPMGAGFVFITPKYRWGAHSTATDLDLIAVLFGPFGDFYRKDKRKPFVGESYCDMNPKDARALGLQDGDYAWIEADPSDRPFRGYKPENRNDRFTHLMARVRYYPGIPTGIVRMWFNMYQASPGSVKAHEERPDKLAKNSETGYQALFRYGGHQSCTRAWLRPTLMTETLVRKGYFGQQMGTGFESDIHCPAGAPKESFVKIRKAEDGGESGKGIWRPAQFGLRPAYQSENHKKYVRGEFVKGVE
ncbi:MAG: molybdopterin-dependent oxidoreductase [Armatimonadetes bacterium]|nr:molybdopterin-dependent oxidoreductase [Armatimonadota bacterium]